MKRAILLLALLCCACSGPAAPLAPTQPATSTSEPPLRPVDRARAQVLTGPYTISGVVSEGGRPVAGANVNAWVTQANMGYSYMFIYGAVLTGADGSYRLTNLPAGVKVWPDTYKTGYVQQCAAPQLAMAGDAVVDMELVSRANVSASVPPSKPGFRSVSGTIYETTPAGPRPAAGAFVDFEPIDDSPAAITYSDSEGRYLLCGIPENENAAVGTNVNGKAAYTIARPGQTTGVDITVP